MSSPKFRQFCGQFTAPLFMSSELRTLSESAECIFENEILIDIYQDTSGTQGKHIMKSSNSEAWRRIQMNRQFTVAITNDGTDGAARPFTTIVVHMGITRQDIGSMK